MDRARGAPGDVHPRLASAPAAPMVSPSAAPADPRTVRRSAEHGAVEWLPCEAAMARLERASNRAALTEPHGRLDGETAE